MHSIDPIGSARGGGGFEFLVKRTERFDAANRVSEPCSRKEQRATATGIRQQPQADAAGKLLLS